MLEFIKKESLCQGMCWFADVYKIVEYYHPYHHFNAYYTNNVKDKFKKGMSVERDEFNNPKHYNTLEEAQAACNKDFKDRK